MPMRRPTSIALILLTSAVLSRVGIIALVAQGYSLMAWGFLLLFAVPLLTVGVRRLLAEPRPPVTPGRV